MAKKTTAKQNTNNGESKFKGIRNFFTSERTRFITGLVISIVTIYVGLALISFFFTGGADQSKIENIPLSDLVINRGSVENWTGVRGAFLADLLMNRWFGISSFLILFFLGSVGAKLMNLSRVSLLKRFLFSAAMLIWGSLFFAFIFIRGYEDTFIYLGGQHGYYLSEVMMNNIGIPGTVLLLVGLFLIVAIFTSKRTIPFLQNVFSFGWLKNRLKRDKSETTEVPEEEEDVEGEAEVYAPVEKTVAAPQPVAYRETVEENIGPDEYVFDTETEMRKAEVETEVPQKDDFEFEVARGDDPVVEAGNGNNTIFEVEVPEEEEEFDQSQLGKYDPRLDLSRYMFPTLDLLKFYDSGNVEVNREELEENQQMIKRTLEDFGINIASIKATVGPTVTLYEIIPEAGVRISKIKNLEDDIALSLSALQIRIIAPMPGKGTIGIEVPNNKPQTVSMQSVVASRKFQECTYDLPVAIGRTIVNEVFMFDLCKTPHLLVAGATGQGKSVGLNAIITSLLYKKHPAELKFVMVDPKQVEFSIYSKIERHYLAKLPNADKPIVTEPGDAVATLNSLVIEMEN
ncbi:DNA translocase FtsK 4TM domain-containing protein, partial [Parabacteroides merdae]